MHEIEPSEHNSWMSLLVPQTAKPRRPPPRTAPVTAPAGGADDASTVSVARFDRELTDGELDVLRRMTEGATNAQIAQARGCAVTTVKVHVARIFRKLGVANRTQAVLAAEHLPALRRLRPGGNPPVVFQPEWLRQHAALEAHPAGTPLFARGSHADRLYYLHTGHVRLVEIGETLAPGAVFGEIGVFSPTRQRTSSAVCETAVWLFAVGAERARELCLRNPWFALHLAQLAAQRLSAARGLGGTGTAPPA